MSEELTDFDNQLPDGKPGAAETSQKPFKFLDPYSIEDRDIFFGRDDEIKAIYKRFYSSRILLVYGESGSGKTSLVQCGLKSDVLPEDVHFITVRAAIDPLNALQKELLKITDFSAEDVPSSSAKLLKEAVFTKSKTIGLIFDQFEELFTVQSDSDRKKFISEMKEWLTENLDIRIIICIREEYYARLTEIEASIPQIYQNRLWVPRMSREQARDVIVKPCEKCGVSIEPELAEELSGVMTKDGKGADLPILQLVLDTLYNKAIEKSSDSPALMLASYQKMGKIESILSRFVKEKIESHNNSEQFRQVLKGMITPEGTKRMASKQEISEQSSQFGEAIPQNELSSILDRLSKDRIIMKNPDNHRFELRHDALAKVIYQWMTGIEQELMKVRQYIKIWFKQYQERKKLIDTSDLEYIAPYESRLGLEHEVKAFIEQSKQEVRRKQKEEEAERKRQEDERKRKRLIIQFITILVVVVSGLGIFGYINLIESRYNIGLLFNEKAQREVENKNFNAARLYALHALDNFDKIPKNADAEKSIANGILCYPDYPILHSFYHDKHHNKSINSINFSPDGKLLASCSQKDNTIHLWNVKTGTEKLPPLTGHLDIVFSVCFSPNSETLASGSRENNIRFWNIATGKELKKFEGDDGYVVAISFSPDGKLLASSSQEGSNICLWSVITKEQKQIKNCNNCVRVARFSPDGKTLAWGGYDNKIYLWDIETGKDKVLIGHSDRIVSVNFSPDGKTLASGSWDKTIRLWDVAVGEEQSQLIGHSDSVFSVVFSDNKTLVSGSSDKTIRLWDVATGKEKVLLTGHLDSVWSVDFSHNGNILASGSEDNTIKLWDIQNIGKEQLLGHTKFIRSVCISSDGKILASGSDDNTIRLWNIATGKEKLPPIAGHTDSVNSVSFLPDGRILASGSRDSTVRLWDTATGENKGVLRGHTKSVQAVSFSTDGKILASGSDDKTIRLWDTATGEDKGVLRGHTKSVQAVSFSPDGKILASGSDDNTIRLWDVLTGVTQNYLEGHTDYVRSLSFSPDGKTLASGSDDNTIRIWDVATGKKKRILSGHFNYVWSVKFSSDGRSLASGSKDNTIRLWDVATWKEKGLFKGHSNFVSSITFSPDSKTLISGAYDNTIRLWNLSWLYNTLPIQEQVKEAEKSYKMKLDKVELKVSN